MKEMISKFPGHCSCCNAPIKRGARIYWSRATGAIHADCHEKQQAGKPTGPDWYDIHYEDSCAAACGFSPFGINQ